MLKLSERGIAHILLLIILLAGLVAGLYLIKNPQIFKPKAYDSNSQVRGVDDPPPLIITTTDGASRLFKDAGRSLGYNVEISYENEDVVVDFEPTDLAEMEISQRLNDMDYFYHRTLMWLLLDPFGNISGPPIDPWYALCDHLTSENMELTGPEPTILADGKQLQCSDPPPSKDEFELTDSHIGFKYQKIPATLLLQMVMATNLHRENNNLQDNARGMAVSMVPILGTVVDSVNAGTALTTAGKDPYDVTGKVLQAEIGIVGLVFGLPTSIQTTKTIIGKIKNPATILAEVKGGGRVLTGKAVDLKDKVAFTLRITRTLHTLVKDFNQIGRWEEVKNAFVNNALPLFKPENRAEALRILEGWYKGNYNSSTGKVTLYRFVDLDEEYKLSDVLSKGVQPRGVAKHGSMDEALEALEKSGDEESLALAARYRKQELGEDISGWTDNSAGTIDDDIATYWTTEAESFLGNNRQHRITVELDPDEAWRYGGNAQNLIENEAKSIEELLRGSQLPNGRPVEEFFEYWKNGEWEWIVLGEIPKGKITEIRDLDLGKAIYRR